MSVKLTSVLVAGDVAENCAEILASHNISVTTKVNINKEDLIKEIPTYDGLVICPTLQVSKEVLSAGKNLKIVGGTGVGVDNIDVAAAREKGIVVINAPGATAVSACELTCGLIMALARNVVQAGAAMREGRWERSNFIGTELMGKTIAVVGLGKVGREVAIRMHAFRMRVLGFDPILTKEECDQINTVKMELDDIWPFADYITLHIPLADTTKKFVDAEMLKRCKKGVKIINVGRGGLIREADLLDALLSGQVGGAALELFAQESPTDSVTREIVKHPAVIVTPQLGAATVEAQIRVGREIAEQLVKLVKRDTSIAQRARDA